MFHLLTHFHQVVVEEVTGGSSSVLGGMDELNVEVESENFNGFATSRLVVQDSMLATSDDLRSPSVELVSPSVETMSPPSELAFGLQSPGSSVGLVSLESSVCLASPSPSLEVVTPPQEEDPTAPSMDGRMQEELASSVSSSKTVVSEQREGLDDRLAEAMVEESRQPVSASCSSRSSEVLLYYILFTVFPVQCGSFRGETKRKNISCFVFVVKAKICSSYTCQFVRSMRNLEISTFLSTI